MMEACRRPSSPEAAAHRRRGLLHAIYNARTNSPPEAPTSPSEVSHPRAPCRRMSKSPTPSGSAVSYAREQPRDPSTLRLTAPRRCSVAVASHEGSRATSPAPPGGPSNDSALELPTGPAPRIRTPSHSPSEKRRTFRDTTDPWGTAASDSSGSPPSSPLKTPLHRALTTFSCRRNPSSPLPVPDGPHQYTFFPATIGSCDGFTSPRPGPLVASPYLPGDPSFSPMSTTDQLSGSPVSRARRASAWVQPPPRRHSVLSAAAPPPVRPRSGSVSMPPPRHPAESIDPDLLLPWKDGTTLRKADSSFLQNGFCFGFLGEGPDSPLSDAYPTGTSFFRLPAVDYTEAADQTEHQRAALRQEMERQRLLEERIHLKERRREAARRLGDRDRRQEGEGLRSALWLMICALTTRDLWTAPERRHEDARITRYFLPRWRLLAHRRRLQADRLRRLTEGPLPAPTPEALRGTGPLFAGWDEDLLAAFIKELTPAVFLAGEYICHQGDPSDVLYVLTEGSVDVVVRPANSMSKARGKRTGVTVATFAPVRYFGEYGVVAEEPRSATLYCAQRTVAWACSHEGLLRHLRNLPVPVRRGIDAAFEADMAKIYPVRAPQLASLPLFRGAPLDALNALVTRLEPVLLPANTTIVEAGTPGACVYFIAKGRCRASRPGRERVIAAGDCFGARACIFLEPHAETIETVNAVQTWRLRKAVLQDFMLSRPHHFLDVKGRLNEAHAQTLERPTVEDLAGCLGMHLPIPILDTALRTLLKPVVTEAGGVVVSRGEPLRWLLYVVAGTATEPGGHLAVGPAGCLGLAQVLASAEQWDHTIVAKDRLEGWRLSLSDLAALPAIGPRSLLHRVQALPWLTKGTPGSGSPSLR